jgi:hypothetical protein
VIWAKTDAGRAEMQSRALIKDRARRNLLLLIDGTQSENALLRKLAGITADDFQQLRKLDLIAPAAGAVTVGGASRVTNADSIRPTVPQALANATSAEHREFSTALKRLIAVNLGLRGFTLTLAVDKASTTEELSSVAQRMIEQVRERKGDAAAAEARHSLYGD